MRNKILEHVIRETIDTFPESEEFKQMLEQYIQNRFKGNVSDSDFGFLLNCINVTEDDPQ